MDPFILINILYIMIIIVGIRFILIDFYAVCHHGKFVIKLKEDRGSAIFWIVPLIAWVILLWLNISDYNQYGENRIRHNILLSIVWIILSILNIIKSLIGSEIRENGIYNYGNFCKWSKVMSYSWVSPNIIQVKVNTFFKMNRSLKIVIKEELKFEIDEVIQKNLGL